MTIAAGLAGLFGRVLHSFHRYGRYRRDVCTDTAVGLVGEAALAFDLRAEWWDPAPGHSHGLTGQQLRLLAEMCEDARLCVTAGIETCECCDRSVCSAHAQALSRAESYSSLARQLGAQIHPWTTRDVENAAAKTARSRMVASSGGFGGPARTVIRRRACGA